MTAQNQPVEDLTTPPLAVVTGASSGIGLAAAEELGRRGWAVAVVGRDPGRLDEATKRVRAVSESPVTAFQCDFAVLNDVRDLARRLRDSYRRIDVLANNAGASIFGRHSTVDGFEATIQTNHLAPFLLSHELRDLLRGGRIINTASMAHRQGRLDPDDLSSTRLPYASLVVYGSAKQANIAFAAEATRRWPEILSVSYNPGVVRTRFGSGSGMYTFFYRYAPGLRRPAKGAETLVWLATTGAPQITPGGYYMDRRLRQPIRRIVDPAFTARLWDASLAAVGLPAE
jgi:NAD(P)-dependent dehydrogenase (short-subunit alcohol dehydrogenase family)